MFFKFLEYLITILIVLSTFSASFGRDLSKTEVSCGGDVVGYCSDCETSVLCNGEEIASESTCTGGLVCQQISTFSTCVDSANVEACKCPQTGVSQIQDFYDDNKFLVCVEGERHIESCTNEDDVFDDESDTCRTPYTTLEPTTTAEPTSSSEPDVTRSQYCEDGVFSYVPVSCTEYQICYSSNEFSDIETCPLGSLFSTDTNKCEEYLPFSCTDETGYQVDPHDCSVYYLCYEGEIIGNSLQCSDDKYFENDLQTCVPKEESTCIPIVDCGICSDANTYIGIDCNNYYHCEKNPDEDAELPFIPVLKYCPEGTCFDQSTTFCELQT